MEANHCFPIGSQCDTEGLEPPVWEYELYVDGVCSITGGYVYRGNQLYGLVGKYLYGDWCTGDIWALEYDGEAENTHLLTTGINITAFGVDENEELLFCGNSEIFKLTSSLGDINDDGGIDVLDIVSLINLILNEGYQSNADINEDGNLNVLDVVSLINVILG